MYIIYMKLLAMHIHMYFIFMVNLPRHIFTSKMKNKYQNDLEVTIHKTLFFFASLKSTYDVQRL